VFARSGLVALQFLTRLPVRLDPAPRPHELGLSLAWYPIVGLLLGSILWAEALALHDAAPILAAALILVPWVLVTGALHLDGLADTADAWVGGHGDRERTLAIMKDPHAGPTAVTAIACVLILKFASLCALLSTSRVAVDRSAHDLLRPMGLLLPPLLGRASVPLLFATTPYVRAGGIGAQMALSQSRRSNVAIAFLSGALCFLGGLKAAVVVAACAALFLLVRRCLVRTLGGFTGDCAGALIELTETVAIVVLGLIP
jgi:adenosylcobinamide-GDP ribazoletransferase